MFSQAPELYDLIYSCYKDYAAESAAVAASVRQANPAARTVLDVACGTGEHARHLTQTHGFAVDGLDIEPGFARIARGKLPQATITEADMCDFHLGRRYDAVVCLFSAIGYVRTVEHLRRAIRCLREHLREDGVALVEPWLTPDRMQSGLVFLKTGEKDETKVCRMGRTTVEGRVSRIDFEYLIGQPHSIRRVSEVHELGLFTVDEMTDAFTAGGLEVKHDPEGPTGRGLYIARVAK